MKFALKTKYRVTLLLIFTLLIQLVGPVAANYVYAEEDVGQEEEVEAKAPEDLEDVEDDDSQEVADDKDGESTVGEPEDGEIDAETPNEEGTPGEDGEDDLPEDGMEADPEEEEEPIIGPEEEGDIIPFSDGEGRNLGDISEFNYNISINDGTNEIEEGSTIHIEELTVLGYEVKFDIGDDFSFVNNDYLKLDISPLSKLGGLELPEPKRTGRIIFKVGGEDIDAAYYSIENNILIITFDKGEALNGKRGREGYVNLQFNVEETNEELELIEEIMLEGKETKTFIVKRQNSNVTAISKEGKYLEDEDNIEWVIDVNTELSILDNAILTDNIPEGLKVEKIEIIDLKVTTDRIIENGIWKEIVLSSESVTIDGNTLELTLGNLVREAKRIKIITSIDDNKTGKIEFENIATLKADDTGEITASDTISFDRITGISKSGAIKGNNEIEWTIEFRGNSNNGTSDIEDVLTLPDNIKLVLDKESVKLNDQKIEDEDIEISEDNKITFKNIPNSTELRTLKYITKVIFEGNGEGTFEISNSASHNGSTASAKVSITRGEIVKKDNGKIYGDNNGNTYIDWNIEINKNNENWKEVIIEENIPKGFEFVVAKIGNTKLTSTVSENTVRIEVGEITQKEIITVTTRLKDKIDSIEDVENTAKIQWEIGDDYGWGIIGGTINKGPYEDDVNGNFTKDKFKHVIGKSSTIPNYKDKTIDWTVDYKTYNDNVNGLKIEDELRGEQKYDETSFKLILNGTELKSTEYTLRFNNTDTEFTLTLVDSVTESEKYNHIVLKYKTKFDLTQMDDIAGQIELKNSVTIKNKSKDTLEASSSQKINQDISKNGSKSVSKESGENRKFNWIVKLNHKSKNIDKSETIIDTLTGKQRYIEESIKIYKAELNKDGNLEKVTGQYGELILGKDYTIEFKDNTENNERYSYHTGMTISFNENLTTPIILEYQTEAVGISEETYGNKVSYNNKDYPASKRYNEYNEFITKKLLNDRNGKVVKGDVLKWKLVINKSLSEIHNFELKDIMSDGLIFIEDSLIISKDDEVVTEEFGITSLEDKNGFKLTKDLLDEKYIITYETLVRGDIDTTEISNDVYMSGYSLEKKLVGESKFQMIGRSEAGGSGYSDNDYEVKIIKVDVNDNAIKEEIEFKLITETKIGNNTYISEEELTTNGNGELTIKLENNNYNTYYIKEVKAPEGYILLDELIEVRLDSSDNSKRIEIKVVNIEKVDIKGTKIWVDGPESKPAIQLQLYRQIEGSEIDGEIEKVGEPVTLSEGTKENNTEEYTWTDLPKTDEEGNKYIYTIDEVETPENYGKSTPKDNDDGLTIINTYESPKTEITGRKIWKGGPIPRPTIELQLYRDGEAYGDPVKLKDGETSHKWTVDRTDSKGVEYTYTVDEVEVPENYVKVESESKTEVINQYVSPKTEVTGIKEWIGGPSRKPTIELQLYRNGEKLGSPVELKDGETKYTWTNLDEFDENGREYTYTVDEVNVPRNYRSSKSDDGLTIINRYRPPTDPGRPPTRPEDPDKPEKPKDPKPEEPKDPEDLEDPEDPGDVEVQENPEDPLIDLDGDTPQGGTNVDEEDKDEDDPTIGLDGDTPKGGTKVDKPILPKTGEGSNIFFYFTGVILIAIGLFFRRRTI